VQDQTFDSGSCSGSRCSGEDVGTWKAATTINSEGTRMGSVIKKRRKRMSKKKHRKLLRKTRHARRKQGK
jgi:Mitochondrial domain of unknown function (DUF1713)